MLTLSFTLFMHMLFRNGYKWDSANIILPMCLLGDALLAINLIVSLT